MRYPKSALSHAITPFGLTFLLILFSGCRAPADPMASPASGAVAQKASESGPGFKVTTMVDGLDRPWGLAFISADDLLVSERSGKLRRVRGGVLQERPLDGVPEVFARGQGGLFEVLLHPNFSENRWVYLSYAKPGPDGATTAISRGKLGESGLEEVEEIFVADAWSQQTRHFGGRMIFDDQGALYLSIGDRADQERAQNVGDHAGSLLRLDENGKALPDNPFVRQDGARPELFSIGNRNIQGLIQHPQSKQIWAHEHGPLGGDELNIIKPGANYGWPLVTYGKDYDGSVISEKTTMEGIEPPVLHWTPSIACSGLAVYTGDAFPQWKENFFVGALVQTHLRRVAFADGQPDQQEVLLDGRSRIRTVVQGPDGLLYLLTDSPRGEILRLEPSDS